MPAIFISHSTKDNAEADAMGVWLEQQGHKSYFIDYDEQFGIGAGTEWEQVLYQRLRQCQAVVALVSSNWIESKWCFAEMIQAREKGKPIFPVKLEPCELPEILSRIQGIDLSVDKDAGYRRLAAGLKEQGLDPSDIFVPDPTRAPYPGFPAFEEADAAVFFGRTAEIQSARETLEGLRRHNQDVPRLILFLGSSGSGKSSLVRAGLIPRLKKDEKNWLPLRPFRPQYEINPLDALAFAIADTYKDLHLACDSDLLRGRLRSAGASTPIDSGELLRIVRELASAADRREATVLLTVDQAEELFNSGSPETGKAFLRFLGASLSAGDWHLMAVATLRSSSLGVFQNQVALVDSAYRLGLAYRLITLEPLPIERYAELIKGPARLTGIELEEPLIIKLLQDADQPDSLPLLAFTLRRLYDLHFDGPRANPHRRLTLRGYEDMGGLAGAVQNAAEQIFKEHPPAPDEINAFREAFIPGLIRYSEDRSYSRRRALRGELPTKAGTLLDGFVDARILVASVDKDNNETVEIAHEALLRTWPTLISWLVEDRDKLRQYNAIVRAAKDWDEGDRKTDLLIHRDGRLKDAVELTSERRFTFPPGLVEHTYLAACVADQKAREAAAQAERDRRLKDAERLLEEEAKRAWAETERATEAERVQRLEAERAKDAEKRAKEQKEAASKLRRLAWVLAAVALAAVGGAIFGFWQKNEAEIRKHAAEVANAEAKRQEAIAKEQRNTAVARQLIAQSQLKLREEYDTALLLSIQAYRGFPTMETLTHLHYMLDSRREVGRIFHGHKGKVIFVSITPDGSKVVSGDDRGTMITRQLQGEQSPISLQTVDRVEAMALHPSKEIVALAVDDEIVLWDLAKRQPIGEALKGHHGAVTSLAFDPEGKLLASGSGDNTAMLWDVASRSALHKPLKGHLDNSNPLEMAVGVNAVAFSPDGALLATTGNDNRVLLWDVATGERYGKPLEGHKTRPDQLFPGVQAVAFGPNGTLLATGGRDHEIFLWDVKTQSPVGDPLQADSGVTALAFAGNENVLFSATEFGRIQAWSIADHSPIAEPFQGYPGKITCLAVDPSAPGLISGGENGKLIVWRPFRFSDRLARLLTHPAPDAVPVLNPNTGRRHFPDLLRRVTFSDGGELVASASDDGVVVVWDAKSGREIDRSTTHPAGIFALKFDPSAKRIAVAGYGDMVVVREIGSGRWKGLRGHGRAVGALAFSADGSMLAAGTASGSCKIWKLDPPELLGEWKLHERPVALVAFREKDHELISVDLDGKVKLWDVASRKLVRADDGRGESEGTFAISGNGNVLASCIHGGIALWDVAKWTPLGVGTIPVGESNQAGKGLALSADGSVVAFGQGTGITLYSTRSGERLLPALAVRASLDDVALSPEGKTLAAVGAEPDVYLWNLDVESWVGRAFEVAGRILTEDEWQHYCPGQPYHPHPDR